MIPKDSEKTNKDKDGLNNSFWEFALNYELSHR